MVVISLGERDKPLKVSTESTVETVDIKHCGAIYRRTGQVPASQVCKDWLHPSVKFSVDSVGQKDNPNAVRSPKAVIN